MTELSGNQPPLPDPATPATPSAAQPPAPPPALPGASYPVASYPPPIKKSSTLKIVLIIVGIFVGLGIIAAGVVGYGVYKVVKGSHITTGTQPVTEADLGVPIYPGATQGKSVRMTIVGKDMITASFLSSDPREQVIAFYKSNLGPGAIDATTLNGESLRLDKGADESVVVTITDQPGGMGGRTQIVIVHAAKATAQPD